MRCLKLAVLFLAYALITPAFADSCCPNGCVQDFNPSRCVQIGTQNSCGAPFACGGGSRSPSGGSGSGGGAIGGSSQPQPCIVVRPTNAQVEAATNQCVNDLRASAQLVGCFFENDAGRAEDARTGLSCPDRQGALAQLCRQRCANYAIAWMNSSCVAQDRNSVWKAFFGDIAGELYGSASVQGCGHLRSSYFNRVPRAPPQRFQP
jgi:hypothetical protein